MVVMEEAVVEGAAASEDVNLVELMNARARSCLLYTSPSPRDCS